jgi:hypothetical protein
MVPRNLPLGTIHPGLRPSGAVRRGAGDLDGHLLSAARRRVLSLPPDPIRRTLALPRRRSADDSRHCIRRVPQPDPAGRRPALGSALPSQRSGRRLVCRRTRTARAICPGWLHGGPGIRFLRLRAGRARGADECVPSAPGADRPVDPLSHRFYAPLDHAGQVRPSRSLSRNDAVADWCPVARDLRARAPFVDLVSAVNHVPSAASVSAGQNCCISRGPA